MIQKKLKIINKLGLHARASAKFTQLASKFTSEVWITFNQNRVNAKSIMGVMMLAAGYGSVILLEINGDDEKECLIVLDQLIQNYFGEGQ